MSNKTLLLLKQIPPSIVTANYNDNTKQSPARSMRITQLVYDKELNVVYSYLEQGELLDKLITLGKKTCDIQGVDYAEQYKRSFDKSSKPVRPTDGLLYIYNVGLEPANNYEYSDKVLRGFIQSQLNRGGQVVLTSEHVDNTTFRNRYPLSFELVEQQIQYNKIKVK